MSDYTVPFRSGFVVWLTGLPSSGKSTLAAHVADHLRATGSAALILDEADVRAALRPAPAMDETGHDAFYETLGRLAALCAAQGFIVLVAATAHRRCFRARARSLSPIFLEVFVDTPLEECIRRGNRSAQLEYEPPRSPELVFRCDEEDAPEKLTTYILHLLPRR